jgi:hypothetical protein
LLLYRLEVSEKDKSSKILKSLLVEFNTKLEQLDDFEAAKLMFVTECMKSLDKVLS